MRHLYMIRVLYLLENSDYHDAYIASRHGDLKLPENPHFGDYVDSVTPGLLNITSHTTPYCVTYYKISPINFTLQNNVSTYRIATKLIYYSLW